MRNCACTPLDIAKSSKRVSVDAATIFIKFSHDRAVGAKAVDLSQRRDALDLYACSLREFLNFDRAPGGSSRAHRVSVDLVHDSEITQVSKKNRGLDNTRKSETFCGKHRLKICKDLLSFFLDGTIVQLAARWIEGYLPRTEKEPTGLHRLRIGTDRSGCRRCENWLDGIGHVT